MIQFNLLPDVKLRFVKAQHVKHQVISGAVILGLAALVLLAFMFFTVNVVQKKSLSDLNSDIKTYSNQLQSISDLSSILTVQNQLNTLPGLHNNKVVASRLFTYVNQLTPQNTTLSQLNVNFVDNTMVFSGEAPSLVVVNTYTDTLKATTFQSGTNTKKAFSAVVLTSFGSDAGKATYTISFKFDPLIFNSAQTVALAVPAGPTVDPAAIFQKQGSGQ